MAPERIGPLFGQQVQLLQAAGQRPRPGRSGAGAVGRTLRRTGLLSGVSSRRTQIVSADSPPPAGRVVSARGSRTLPRYSSPSSRRTARWIGSDDSPAPHASESPSSRLVTGAGAGPTRRSSSALHTPLCPGTSPAAVMITLPDGPSNTVAPPTVKRCAPAEPPASASISASSTSTDSAVAATPSAIGRILSLGAPGAGRHLASHHVGDVGAWLAYWSDESALHAPSVPGPAQHEVRLPRLGPRSLSQLRESRARGDCPGPSPGRKAGPWPLRSEASRLPQLRNVEAVERSGRGPSP